MKKYLFNEICGKAQGEMIIIEANTVEEAIQKSKFTEKIKPYERFETMSFTKMYEVRELGTSNTLYVVR